MASDDLTARAGAAWDAHFSGGLSGGEFADTIARLHAGDDAQPVDPAFAARLGALLQAGPASQRGEPQMNGTRTHTFAAAVSPPTGRSRASPRRRPGRAFNAVATLTLIVAVAFGAYLVNRVANSPGSGVAQIAAPGTPSATAPAAACVDVPRGYFSGPKAGLFVLASQVRSLSPSAPLVDRVQLQGWTIDAGRYGVLGPVQSDQYAGLAVDFVLSGFYSAIFEGPAYAVAAGNLTLSGWRPQLIPAGQAVELAQGDAVMFNRSDKVVVHSASSVNPLVFKRALFTEGTTNAPPLVGQGFTDVIEQSAVLPANLGDSLRHGDGFMLLIPSLLQESDSTPRANCAAPEQIRVLTSLEGPAPATPSSTASGGLANGYALWIFPNLP